MPMIRRLNSLTKECQLSLGIEPFRRIAQCALLHAHGTVILYIWIYARYGLRKLEVTSSTAFSWTAPLQKLYIVLFLFMTMTENIRAVTNWPKLVARLNKNFISFLSFESVEHNLSKEMIATSAHTVSMNLFSTNQTFLLPASASLSISPEGLTFVLGIIERFELWGILSWTTRMPKMTSSRNGEEFVKYIPYKYRSAKKTSRMSRARTKLSLI